MLSYNRRQKLTQVRNKPNKVEMIKWKVRSQLASDIQEEKKNVKVNLNLAVVGSYSCPPPGTLFENPQRLFVSWVLQTAERKADGFLLLGRTLARSVRPCKFPPRLGPRRAANSCSLAP